ASETALTGSSRASMLRLQKQGSREAGVVTSLLNIRERMIGALLVGNNLANISASALATGVFTAWFGEVGVLYATAVMSVLVIIFAEVLPKTVAINAPDRISLLVARPMKFLVTVLSPVLAVIEIIIRGLLKLLRIPVGANQPLLSPTERLRGAVELIHHEGGVEKHDRDMLGGLLDLKDLDVSDVMVHRTEMVMINADLPAEELVQEVLATEYTRIPLWREKPENIIGVLHAKDLLRAIRAADGDISKVDVSAIALPPWFVPEMQPLSEQLKAFRRRKTHFALVVDEYGEVEGLVTLEDILEEIVGDISDEHDVAVAGVRAQPDGSVVVDGSVPIRDLNRAMDWRLPDEEATTIAGLVIHEARSIPDRGQSFTFHGFRFRVLRRERNRITALRIVPLPRDSDVPEKKPKAGTAF
ncbi:MAG TPA: HlyC/CorC family transporter, partial [Afipia sp.]